MNRLVKLVFSSLCMGFLLTSQAIELGNSQQIFLDISSYQWDASEEFLSIRAVNGPAIVWQETVQTSYQVRAEIFDPFSGEITTSEMIQMPTNQFEFYFIVPTEYSYDRIEVVAENSAGEQRVLDNISFDDLQLLEPVSAKPVVQALGEDSALISLLNNGPSENRVDILFLGDGYLASEMDQWETDAEALLELFLLEQPYRDYRNYFNAHRLNTPSNESGASHPENDIVRDTAFGAFYNCFDTQRLLCVDLDKVANILDAENVALNQGDIIIVIVNDSEYGGAGGAVAVASTNYQTSELVLHETAHSFGLLADEYEDPLPSTGSDCATATPTDNPNVSVLTEREQIKWRHWINPNTEIPTPYSADNSVPGLYRGSKYCGGLYRPTPNSKMRSLYRPFDAINEEALILRIYDYASVVDGFSPEADSINIQSGESVQFEVDLLTPASHQLDAEWFVGGQLIHSGATLSSNLLASGSQTLTVVVTDNTSKVIIDTESKLVFEHSWQVDRTVDNPIDSAQTSRVEDDTIYLPYLRNQADLQLYSIELSITSTDPYRFTVTAFEVLESSLQPDAESSFNDGLLSIPELIVGSISYAVTLRLIETEPTVVFELESATIN